MTRISLLYHTLQGSEAEPEEVIHLEPQPAHRTPASTSAEAVDQDARSQGSREVVQEESSKKPLLSSDSSLKELREKAPRGSTRRSVAGKKRSVTDQPAGYVHPPIEDSEIEEPVGYRSVDVR